MKDYCKRLIEVDLPIKRISEHARREKSIRHGHISTLHIWWARRPLAACRAVLCAALWPDPADDFCPDSFRKSARQQMVAWAQYHPKLLSQESFAQFVRVQKDHHFLDDNFNLRKVLLDFIADFASWDNSNNSEYLKTSRALTLVAHESLGGIKGTKPFVIDPFAGGGSIPIEALRIGADVFASDLNPVAVMLNKVMLEYVPKYGHDLSSHVMKWGQWIKEKAQAELAEFYPLDSDGACSVVHIWARTITCEGPSCGAEVPLLRSLWLTSKESKATALKMILDLSKKRIDFDISINVKPKDVGEGTVKRSSCTCPICGYTTPADRVRKQLIPKNGGANSSRLICLIRKSSNGVQQFGIPTEVDINAFAKARAKLKILKATSNIIPLVPDEPLPYLRSIFNVHLIGIDEWGKLFNDRQCLAMITLVQITRNAIEQIVASSDRSLAIAIGTCLAFAIDRCADYWSSLATWAGEFVRNTFGRQALGIIWDYAEVNGFSGGSGNYIGAIDWICRCIDKERHSLTKIGQVGRASACDSPLPDGSANVFMTDPPYYDAVPYADLSDFFYVWLKRSVGEYHNDLFNETLSPKKGEIVQLSERNQNYAYKTRQYYEDLMKQAMLEGRRVLDPNGIGVVVFAHKTTIGWETQLQAMIDAGWTITGSWPIDTERPGRMRANNSAALASSIHLICRPRETLQGGSTKNSVGDWREVLQDLPRRIHEWLPRLAKEGIVGADAIFSCLGPALEIFSRYSIVEKASGEQVLLREYLEHVWAAVAKEALNMIFQGADATGFEEDARLTAMWLWTLSTGTNGKGAKSEEIIDEADEDVEDEKTSKKISGFALEYDAARKIAQGLGAHLENMTTLVEIKGSNARLLPVSERTGYLFGKKAENKIEKKKAKSGKQLSMADIIGKNPQESQSAGGGKIALTSGKTTLDQIHQSMLLFGLGESGYLKKLLVEDGAGADPRFWRLAQTLSALYPSTTTEKRWIDGVLARKKTLGL